MVPKDHRLLMLVGPGDSTKSTTMSETPFMPLELIARMRRFRINPLPTWLQEPPPT